MVSKIAHFGSKNHTFSLLFGNMIHEPLFSKIFVVFRRLRPLILLAWPMFLKDFHVFAISLRGSKKHPKIGQKSLKNSKKILNFSLNFWMRIWSSFGIIWAQFWTNYWPILNPFWLHLDFILPPKCHLGATKGRFSDF